MSLSRISHAKIVGFSRLYCSIFETTAGVATLGLLPPMSPGGRSVPVINCFIKKKVIKTNLNSGHGHLYPVGNYYKIKIITLNEHRQ